MAFGLADEVVDKIGAIFEKNENVEEVIMYGSRAKGTYRNGSDIDLCLKNYERPMTELLDIKLQLDALMLPYEIDLSCYNKLTNDKLIEHIDRVGVIFWSRKNENISSYTEL